MNVSQSIRERLISLIKAEKATLYSIAKESGVGYATVTRFVSEERPDIRASTLDSLANYLNAHLVFAGSKDNAAQPKKKK